MGVGGQGRGRGGGIHNFCLNRFHVLGWLVTNSLGGKFSQIHSECIVCVCVYCL